MEKSNHINMDKSSLKKLSKSKLIKLLLKNENKKPVTQKRRPIPTPRKSVKQMVKQYEDNIILSPVEFRDNYKPIPAPRTKKNAVKKPIPAPRTIIKQTDNALKGFTKSFEINIRYNKNPLKQMQNTREMVERHLANLLNDMQGLKYVETLKVTFEKISQIIRIKKTAYFNSKSEIIINKMEIADSTETSEEVIMDNIDKWVSEGSGWIIQSVDAHYLNVVKYKPIQGSSYIKLPSELRNSKKGLINIKNKDNECFRWCHIRHINPQKKYPQRIKKVDKPYVKKLDYSGIEFPVGVKHYNKIEKQNSININVFGYEKKQPYPIYVSKEKYEDHMELLLVTENENKHYVLIKDFNRFMFNQTKHENRKHFCMHCLQCFSSERVLKNHKNICIQVNGAQAIKMPDKDNNILKFNNFNKQQPVPFVIYADFEAITEKIHGCQQDGNKSYTEAYQKHTDCGYGYKVVCCYDNKYTKPIQIYRGEKAVYKFMENILEEVKYCKKVMKKHFNKPLIMTELDEQEFEKATTCHICDKKYTEKDIRVRDHCHITGEFRGSAHQECNLKLRINPEEIKIPVIFHNLRGYDSHFIMQEIGSIVKNNTYTKNGKEIKMNINAIPNNMEKYMAFMLGSHLTFIDSFQFMSSSLDKLVSNLPEEALKYTSKRFQKEKLNLMTRKGIYPYDYMDSFEKFNKTELPTKEEFYSILNNEHISDEDYCHAQKVWNTFPLQTMGEYHNLYLKSDILLLADVFENFRKTCLQYYKLDPCHYFTSPGLSWDAMLKMTNIQLELMTDIDMFQFIEKGMRGGISYIANRYGKANNKYMREYDDKAPSKYIMYLDANNLYGWAMSQYLPTGGFKWMTDKQINKIDLAKYNENSEKGLIIEVDLEYPKELHNLHNDYPLAAERVCVNNNMLSEYCKRISTKYNISTGLVHKLIPTLSNKEKYVLHYRNLQLYLTLNRPGYVGMCILDLSKTLMYNFHYNYIKEKYGDKAKLLFTDTDSLTYEIEAEDVYQDFWNDKDQFDNSDYPESSQYFDKTNKKIIGKFKDEACSIPITEFVGLRSKMYSYIKDNNKGGKTAKGIKKNIIKNNIKHEDYKNVLLENKQMQHTMKTIRSSKHQLGSYEINKVSLSCFDDKRYILTNGIKSYAYGHYEIQ